MLVALLSSIEPVAGQANRSRAHLSVAGQTVLERQVRLALSLGCERVICLAQGLPPELLAVQHVVERDGKRFHAIAGPRALAGLVTVADEVLAIADGVLIDPALADWHLARGRNILALPVEPAINAGHERIDRDHAWAGAFRVPAGDVERLTELAADVDTMSALMRIALQRGRPLVELSADTLADGRIAIIGTDEAARSAARRIVDAALTPAPWTAPANAAIDRGVRRTAVDVLARPAVGSIVAAGGAILTAIGLAAAWNGVAAAAFGSLAGAAALARFGRGMMRISSLGRGWWNKHRDRVLGLALDALLLATVLIVTPRSAWGRALFVLAMVLGLIRLAAIYGPRWLAELAQDRVTLFALFAIASAVGWLGATLQLLAIFLLVALLLVSGRPGITRA